MLAIGLDAAQQLAEAAATFSLQRRHQRRRIRLAGSAARVSARALLAAVLRSCAAGFCAFAVCGLLCKFAKALLNAGKAAAEFVQVAAARPRCCGSGRGPRRAGPGSLLMRRCRLLTVRFRHAGWPPSTNPAPSNPRPSWPRSWSMSVSWPMGATAHLAQLVQPHAGQRHGRHQPRRLGGEIRIGGHRRQLVLPQIQQPPAPALPARPGHGFSPPAAFPVYQSFRDYSGLAPGLETRPCRAC